MSTLKTPLRKKPTGKTNSVQSVKPAKGGEPLYQAMFNQLCQDIMEGYYPVGALLPTEHELCGKFSVSRFTARNALSMLTDAGLVTRRPRVGSVVTSQSPRTPYVQTLETVEDLLQYAESTRFEISHWDNLPLDHTLSLGDIPLTAGQNWIYGVGLRRSKGLNALPVCVTRVYLNPAFQKVVPLIRRRKNAVIYRWVEKVYGIKMARIEQRIDACSVTAIDAKLLLCPVGSPALRIQRLYFDANNMLLEISDSLHPGGRFSYQMSLLRSGLKP